MTGNRIMYHVACVCAAAGIACSALCAAPDAGNIILPKPQLEKGRPLMQVLKDRKSTREFSGQPLSRQDLSNLLWAAFGINRPETNGRTAPSAMNMQEIDGYVTLAEGLFLYEAKNNELKKIHGKDIRALTGKQGFVKDAAANIVLVGDKARLKNPDAQKYMPADAAFISENIYLYCASEGLATVVRASFDKPELAKVMELRPDQEIIFAQTVGYPKK